MTREEYAIGIEIGEEGGDEVIIRAKIEVEAWTVTAVEDGEKDD